MADEKRILTSVPGLFFFCFPVAADRQPTLWKESSLFSPSFPRNLLFLLAHFSLGFVSILILCAFRRKLFRADLSPAVFPASSPCSSSGGGGDGSTLRTDVGRGQLRLTSL